MILPLMMLIAVPDDCDTDAPQQELNMCLADAFAAADAELNRAWKPAYSAMQRRDHEGGSLPTPSYAQALLVSQRAWLTYRDAQCLSESQQMWGGSGESMLLLGCKLRLTRERITYLRSVAAGQ